MEDAEIEFENMKNAGAVAQEEVQLQNEHGKVTIDVCDAPSWFFLMRGDGDIGVKRIAGKVLLVFS